MHKQYRKTHDLQLYGVRPKDSRTRRLPSILQTVSDASGRRRSQSRRRAEERYRARHAVSIAKKE